MRELIKALKKVKGGKEIVDEIVVLIDVEADVLPDTPEKIEKLKTFLRVVRRLQASNGSNVLQIIKKGLKDVFYTAVLASKIESSAERFTMGALTEEALRGEIYWHVKHQLHWIITMYKYDPTKFPKDLDAPMLYTIISKF